MKLLAHAQTQAEQRRQLLWLFGLALPILGLGIGWRDAWPADEPRFALMARDMVDSGRWFFPNIAGEYYADKPPMFMWMLALGYALTGSLRVALLLPSLLASLGTLWLTYDIGRRLWNHRAGLAAALTLLCSVQFGLQARTAQIDMVECFWITLGLYGLLRHLLLGPQWRWFWAGCAAMGLGVITKGVGFLPALVLIPYIAARKLQWRHLPAPGPSGGWRWPAGALAFFAAVGIWVVPMLMLVQASGDPALAAYRNNILFHQTVQRYADPWLHLEPFYYYFTDVIPWAWLPTLLLFPWLIPGWKRRLQRHDARYLLLLGWIVLVLLFFSSSHGKRGVYILPVLPALSLAAATFVPLLLQKARVQQAGLALLGLLAVALGGILVYLLLVPAKAASIEAKYEFMPWGLLIAAAGLALGWFAWALLKRRGLLGLCGLILSLWLVYGGYGYAWLNDVRSGAPLMRAAYSKLGAGEELAVIGWKEQMMLQAGHPITHFGFRRGGLGDELYESLRWLLAAPQRRLLMPQQALEDACLLKDKVTVVGTEARLQWFLADTESVSADCAARAQGPVTGLRYIAPGSTP